MTTSKQLKIIGVLTTIGSFFVFNFLVTLTPTTGLLYQVLFYVGIVLFAGSWFWGSGSIDFWSVASDHPEKAYQWFKERDEWQVFEGSKPDNSEEVVPKDEWSGPFRLIVPQVGMVYIYGKFDLIESSQEAFIDELT